MYEPEYDKQEDAMMASIGKELPTLLRPQAEVVTWHPHCGLEGITVKQDVASAICQKLMLHGKLSAHALQVAVGLHANGVPVEEFNAALNDLVAAQYVKSVGLEFQLV